MRITYRIIRLGLSEAEWASSSSDFRRGVAAGLSAGVTAGEDFRLSFRGGGDLLTVAEALARPAVAVRVRWTPA